MAYYAEDVLKIARGEINYLEKESNKNLDDKTANAGDENYTKYARDLTNMNFYNGYKQGAEWCDIFVDWCFVKAFGKEAALALTFQPTNNKKNCGAGCKYSRDYYKKNGRLFDEPQAGDQIFFYGTKNGKVDKTKIAHTGLVDRVDANYVYTIEGNTSSASGVVANGGCVRDKKYKRNYYRFAGFGRPNYDAGAPAVKEEIKVEKPATSSAKTYTVKGGDTLWEIAAEHLGDGKRYKEIMTINGLKSDVIKKGMVLKLSAEENVKMEEAVSSTKTYTVKSGDSLWKIAESLLGDGNCYKEIMTLNGLKSTIIKKGQLLKIPNK